MLRYAPSLSHRLTVMKDHSRAHLHQALDRDPAKFLAAYQQLEPSLSPEERLSLQSLVRKAERIAQSVH